MSRRIIIAILFCTVVYQMHSDAGVTIRIVSLNLHYLSQRNPERLNWADRREAATAVLQESDGDLVALQETETYVGGSFARRNIQLEYLLASLPGYTAAAVGDPAEYPWTQPVLYRSSRFDLIDQGFFFFSSTPDSIYSRSWDGRFPAFASWVRLSDKLLDKSFYLYNVHLDAGSASNRLKAAKLITRRIETREHPEEPVILTGDFNALRWFPTMRTLTAAGLSLAPGGGPTFHFYRGINLIPAIDHLLFTPPFEHRRTEVLRNSYRGSWPSDHYPLVVDLVPGNGR